MKSTRHLLSTPLMVFMGAMILANIAGRMIQPLLPLYLQTLGANIEQVGLFFTLSSIVPLLFQILGGWLSDSIGRLKAIALGSVAGVVGYLVFLIAPTWGWLLIATAMGAMAGSFVAPSYQAFLAEQSTEDNRGRVYGISEGLFMVVGIIGPLLGGFLSDNYGFKALFLVALVLYVAATIIRVVMARQVKPGTEHHSQAPSWKGLKINLSGLLGLALAGGIVTWIFITDGLRDISFSLSGQLMPIYMQDLMGLTKTQIGSLSAFASAATMLLMVPSGWLSDKKGERVGIVSGFLCISFGLGWFLLTQQYTGFIGAWILIGVGEALLTPAYGSLISKVVPNRLRGTAFGLFATSLGLVSLPAPFLGSLLWEHVGPRVPFIVPLVVSTLLLPIMWFKFKLTPTDLAAGRDETPFETDKKPPA